MKSKNMIRKLSRSLWAVAALAPLLAGVVEAQSLRPALTRHVRDVTQTGEAKLTGQLPAEQVMQLDLVLPLSDSAGLSAFLKDIYNPASANFHHYLTVSQFTERFGPTQENYDAVVNFAKSNGFEVVGGSRDGMEVQVKGPVSAIENAFHVTMGTYQHPTENRSFYAPDREPTVNLPFSLWHISGLDNYSIPKPRLVKREDYALAHGLDPEAVVSHATTGSGPSASFLGSDMRAAYYGGGLLNGTGQNLGLFEYEGTDLADVTTYYKNAGQTNKVTITLLSTDGTSTSCVYSSGCDDTEQTLDITQALGMAPDLASLVVYIGSTDTAIISTMTTHSPLPLTIGCSWGWTPADPSTLDPYFEKMAAQGQTFLAASGDSSTWSTRNEAWPADDANVVSVGGTDLSTTGAAGAWMSETAWVDSGGGISPDKIAIPSWQQLSGVINSSNKGSTTLRNGPDVSANANFSYYVCADQTTCTANEYGGTSFAAPLWAGFLALANQQAAANGQPAVGFINPTIYAQNVTSKYGTDFHDITSGTSGSYSAVTGYDLVTGWGSPQLALISSLAAVSTTPTFSVSASPSTVTVLQKASGTTTITTTVGGGFNSAITLSASGAPAGVTVGFGTNPIAAPGSGSSLVTFTVGTTTAGSYPITISATGGGITNTTVVTLVVTTPSSGAFTVAVSPTSGTMSTGESAYAVITTTVSGGFSGTISLSASGMPSGVTVSYSPASITGAGTAHMNITVARNVTHGTYTLTTTATSGSTSHTAVLNLTIN